jgi:hypothetical protein
MIKRRRQKNTKKHKRIVVVTNMRIDKRRVNKKRINMRRIDIRRADMKIKKIDTRNTNINAKNTRDFSI